jgi:hypothetical protein
MGLGNGTLGSSQGTIFLNLFHVYNLHVPQLAFLQIIGSNIPPKNHKSWKESMANLLYVEY